MTVDVDHADGVGISLVAADMECAARVACHGGGVGEGVHVHGVVGVPEGLGLVDMAEGKIIIARAQRGEALGLEGADLEVVPRDVGASHGEVGHHDDGTAVGVALCHAVEHRLQLLRALAEHVGHGDNEAAGQFDDVVVLPAVVEV